MEFHKEYLDLILVPCGLLIMFAYHLFLLYRYLHRPHTTTKGFEDYDKRAWVERIMQASTYLDPSLFFSVPLIQSNPLTLSCSCNDQADNRDITTALSVIQSNITAATFMASVSLTVCSLIGAWISNGSNKFFQSDLIYGDINPTSISIKYICLLICFLLAFSCFVQSIRHFVHATYLISTPDCRIPVSSVETAVIRGDHFWSLGLRALYFALDLLLWFFGPIPMFVSSLVMVIILHAVDSNSRPLHNTRAQGSELQKAKLQGYAEIKK
ncbi:uncharacterized protein LOC114752901 [Neltuma alba]|uniref:uncharacterized protein LOC114736603 n=1 Tax=Neltuma alba TaxID=207710 RepID=UPI0010A2C504|nr:uncharacterized protein LOC114736603 [Prosopis alba]XP_028797434.1 uncharacterized protein LOC114752901 [Prosopis alba]